MRPGGGAPRLEVAESEAIEDVDAVAPGGGGDGKRRASEYARERKLAVTSRLPDSARAGAAVVRTKAHTGAVKDRWMCGVPPDIRRRVAIDRFSPPDMS